MSNGEHPPGRWLERLFEPVDLSSLVFFRVAFGLLMLWDMLYFLIGGRLERRVILPIIQFTYQGFSWLEPWPAWAMKFEVVVMVIVAGFITIGFLYRLSCALFFLGYLHIFLLDKANYNNHDYLIWILSFLMVFIPAHRAGSLDAHLRPSIRRSTAPAWALWLLRFQIGVPYFFGGLAKLNYDWVVLGQPMRLWLEGGRTEGPLQLAIFKQSWSGYFFSWSGLLFDLLIVPLLLWRRTRIWAFLAALGFHLTNSQLFNIGIFPWLMIAASTLYFSPDWPRSVGLVRARKKTETSRKKARKRAKGQTEEAPVVRHRVSQPAMFLLGVWVFTQVLLPFRHLLYPGHVDWTEEGHTFAWRMKIRDKTGRVHFVVQDRATGQSTVFQNFQGVLTHQQQRMMIHDPEMIRQFTHRLADRLEERGQRDFEIRAVTSISLNGRPPRPMIDPTVDLAAESQSWSAATWITPFEEAAPPERGSPSTR